MINLKKGDFLMRKVLIAVLVCFVLAISVPACTPSEKAVSPEEFYKGKSVYVAQSAPPPGAGITTRIFAKYFEIVTGATTVVEPRSGGGYTEVANVAYAAAPDGLTMGCNMGEVVAANWLLDEPAVQYDLTKLTYLGAIQGTPVGFYVKADGPYTSIEKLKAGKNIIVAGASPRGLMSVWPTIGAHLLGLDFKLVTGFRGPPGCKMAVMQGEAQIMGVGIHTPGLRPDLKPLFVLSAERHEMLPDVPALPEVIDMTEVADKMLKIRDRLTPLGPAVFLAPGIPQDRVDYLREVFNTITARDDFKSELKGKASISEPIQAKEYGEAIAYLAANKADFVETMELVKRYVK